MMILYDFPSIVKKYAPFFEDYFSPADFISFKKAVSGFIVSENKTVQGINRMFMFHERDQSVLNKFFNNKNIKSEDFTEPRLQMLQSLKHTRFKTDPRQKGTLSIDNALLKHYGKHFDNIYYRYDPTQKCFRWSHDLVTLHYSDEQTDYPIYNQLWLPPDWEAVAGFFMTKNFTVNQQHWDNRDVTPKKWRNYIRSRYKTGVIKHPEVREVYENKIHIAEHLLRKFCTTYPNLKYPVALDNGYTSAAFCKIINEEFELDYVGSIQETQIIIEGKDKERILLKDFTAKLRKEYADDPKKSKIKIVTFRYRGKTQECYAYCGLHRVNGFEKKQNLVISFLKEDLTDMPRFTITNRKDWHPASILLHRRYRWPVETFHQEGKAEGLEQYQVRNFTAVQTHIALVVTAFCMLKCSAGDRTFHDELQQRFLTETDGTLPFIRRLMKAEGLLFAIEHIYTQLQNGASIESIFQPMLEKIAYT